MTKLAWVGFGALVVINVVWLVMTVRAEHPPDHAEEAYGECRAAIRKLRPEAARIAFPTRDLIRISRRDAAHRTIRGYYVAPGAAHPTWYTCEMRATAEPTWWGVDSVVFGR